MSFVAAVDHLHALGQELAPAAPRRKFDLDHMRILARALGNPQQQFPAILIAGTNGKGSTAATLAAILAAAGYRTGLYTSPHLSRVTERIRTAEPRTSNPEPRTSFLEIPEETFARLYFQVDDAARLLISTGQLPHHPSFFESLTALAFLYFAERNLDIAILEVGLGGRLDATNIIDPILSVITDIALDHQDYLGTTISEIAREKAGILRLGGTLITLPQHPEANQAIGEAAIALSVRAINAADYLPGRDALPNRDALNSHRVILNSDPVILNSNPVILNSDPVILNSDPVILNSDPVILNSDPVILNSDPVILTKSESPSLPFPSLRGTAVQTAADPVLLKGTASAVPLSSPEKGGALAPEVTLRPATPLTPNHYDLILNGELLHVRSPLAGQHQQRNLALAIAAAIELRNQTSYKYPPTRLDTSNLEPRTSNRTSNLIPNLISNSAIEAGIADTAWPGRLEFLPPNLILDVAHNPAGAWTLRAAIATLPEDQPRTLIFSCLRDKDLTEMAQILFPLFDSSVPPMLPSQSESLLSSRSAPVLSSRSEAEGSASPSNLEPGTSNLEKPRTSNPEPRTSNLHHLVLAPIDNPRAASLDDLLAAARALDVPAHPAHDPIEALAIARSLTPANGLILATGSIYLIGTLREAILAHPPSSF